MVAPAFVGVGAVTSSVSPTWPASLTVTAGKEPAGVHRGDRVVLVIAMYGPSGSGRNTVDHFSVSNAAWTPTSPASSTSLLTVPTRVGVHTFTARWDPTLLPVTITPRDVFNNPVGSDTSPTMWWKSYIAAWSPSATPMTGEARTASGGSFLPHTSAPWGTGTFAHDGTAIVIGHTSSQVLGSGTLNGFTTRAVLSDAPQWMAGRTDTIIADKQIVAGASSAGPHFDAVVGVQGGALMFRLDTPDAPISSGWALGLRFGAR